MMKQDDIQQFVDNVISICIANFQKETAPKDDCISMREATKTYGRSWLKRHIETGRISVHRSGSGKNSKMMMSRAELKSLKYKENICEIVKKY